MTLSHIAFARGAHNGVEIRQPSDDGTSPTATIKKRKDRSGTHCNLLIRNADDVQARSRFPRSYRLASVSWKGSSSNGHLGRSIRVSRRSRVYPVDIDAVLPELPEICDASVVGV